jgi:hypothetical protein
MDQSIVVKGHRWELTDKIFRCCGVGQGCLGFVCKWDKRVNGKKCEEVGVVFSITIEIAC